MENLAPDIFRQRLLVEANYTVDIDKGVIAIFLKKTSRISRSKNL